MRNILLFISLVLFMNFSGCLIFNRISYDIKTDGRTGTAEVNIYDFRSDAGNPNEFEEDKEYLFNYAYKSEKFIEDMKKEGKEVISRELHLVNDTLNGRIVYRFNDMANAVENLVYEDGFYFLTLPLDEEIVYTNGEVIESAQYKRIIWDDSFTNLKYELISFSFDQRRYRPLGFHFKSIK
jgi:hypothetical protein